MAIENISVCCQNRKLNTNDTNGTPISTVDETNPKEELGGSYTETLNLGMSRMIKLRQSGFTSGLTYSTTLKTGAKLIFNISMYHLLDGKNNYEQVNCGKASIEIISNPSRYKIAFYDTVNDDSSAHDEFLKKYKEIINMTELYSDSLDETIIKFEELLGYDISAQLYAHFSGAKYEKLSGSQLLEANNNEPVYTKTNLVAWMKKKDLYLAYLAYRQSDGKVLITNPNSLRVVLRCLNDDAITWTVSDSNGGGWNDFHLLLKGSGV